MAHILQFLMLFYYEFVYKTKHATNVKVYYFRIYCLFLQMVQI